MQDDAILLIRFSHDRSNPVFAELVRRHLNFVYATALLQVAGDTHLAEDVAQSVFVDLARKPKTIAKCPVLARWLYTSTRYAAAKAVRSEQRRRSRERIAQAVHEISNHPAHDVEWARIRPWIDEGLRGLSRRDSDAILLRFFEARSFAAIGAKLGLDENAARMRVERALDKLRARLSRRGITSTAVALSAMLSHEATVAAPSGLAAAINEAALISTALGTGVTATFSQFLSTTKLTLNVAGFVAAAAIVGTLAIGIGIHQIREARSAEATLQTAQGEFVAKRERLRALQQRAIADDESLAVLRQTAANSKTSRRTGRSPQEEVINFLAAFPEARGILSGIFKVEAATRYGPFFGSVEMSRFEIEKFEDAVVEARLANLALTANGFSDTSALLPRQDQLSAILGGQYYQQFQDFMQVQPAFSFANWAAVAAGLADVPLSAGQEYQLVRVLIQNTPRAQPGGPIDLSAVNWDAVLPQAQAVVSAAQWDALQAEFFQMQYGQALLAARGNGASTGASQNN